MLTKEMSDLKQVNTEQAPEQEAYAILKELFAVSRVADVRPCRSCRCPVLHMEHLSLAQAKTLEERVRALQVRVEPEAYAQEEGMDDDD